MLMVLGVTALGDEEDDQDHLAECTQWAQEHPDPQLPNQIELCLSNPEIMKQVP